MTASELILAYAADLLFGDSEWFPHPVRLFGALATAGEKGLRRLGGRAANEFLQGAILTGSITSIAWAMGRPKNAAWQVLLAWTALATRSLLAESGAVIEA